MYTPYELNGIARAKYNFTAEKKSELTLKKGDMINLVRQIDQNWTQGQCNGRIGVFPTKYVEFLDCSLLDNHNQNIREMNARALYNFKPQSDIELPLHKGETIKLIRRVDQNWWEGQTGNRQGIFPSSYVKVIASSSYQMDDFINTEALHASTNNGSSPYNSYTNLKTQSQDGGKNL